MSTIDPLPEGRFSGRQEFQALVRQAVLQAQARDWPEMVWCDPDFDDWPLADEALVETLRLWVQDGHGRMRMLASDFRPVQARCARFVRWRRDHDHRFDARSSGRNRAAETPSVLWTPEWVLIRLDPVHQQMVASTDKVRRAQLRQQIDSLWQQSTAGFPATTLGL
jgi:hypothetical protein